MKKYSTFFLCIAVLTIIVTSNQLFKNSKLEAVELKSTSSADSMMVSKESTDGAKMDNSSNYFLPYPGILPNHPLYFLKTFRDRIIEMLIADPVRKSEFYLLQSDKSLSSGLVLIEKKDNTEAEKVLTESSERMNMAISQLQTQKTNARDIPAGILDKVDQSLKKHIEVLSSVNGFETKDFISSLEKNQSEVSALK